MNEKQTAKHTPGTWTVENGPTHPHHVIIGSDGESIAYTVDHTLASASNSRLIAAAPELLDALYFFLEARKDGGKIALAMAADKAEAAIDKATGV